MTLNIVQALILNQLLLTVALNFYNLLIELEQYWIHADSCVLSICIKSKL